MSRPAQNFETNMFRCSTASSIVVCSLATWRVFVDQQKRNGLRIICFYIPQFSIKAEPHIHSFSENSRECWVRVGEQVMCGSVYSYILGIRHYAPNRFSALPNFWKRQILVRILVNIVRESQFSRLLVNLCENDRECYEYSVFTYSRPILGESTYVLLRLQINDAYAREMVMKYEVRGMGANPLAAYFFFGF